MGSGLEDPRAGQEAAAKAGHRRSTRGLGRAVQITSLSLTGTIMFRHFAKYMKIFTISLHTSKRLYHTFVCEVEGKKTEQCFLRY